ncbi:MAG: N-acetylmuramic acid 6-phosphate etherase [Bifidobacteriaceae bacterium]|jgi:N-acetylmuramic acid 6-phosphate etherase|nr:N-acetylmuramic acid 6-phosphate etherase [Bifidobacteriaceae bacterium]
MTGPSRPPTEGRNTQTRELDTVSVDKRVAMILREDAVAVDAALGVVCDLAVLVNAAVERVRLGGQIHYAGAGASGRLAMLDATEATPTFGVEPDLIQAHFPGGVGALVDSTIDLEDGLHVGRSDLSGVAPNDVVIGITASGLTPYVRGALEEARRREALTGLITSNPLSPLLPLAEIAVVVNTGPEALMGSTRLKAGTAAKVVLNAFSTAVMIGLGKTYSNFMVGLVATNDKLRERSARILVEATGSSQAESRAMLAETSGALPLALIRLLSDASTEEAEAALARCGSVRSALRDLSGDAQ